MKKNLIIGMVISGLFVFLAFRCIDFSELLKSFQYANYLYIFPVVIIVLLGHYLRCYRWGLILDSLIKHHQWTIFTIASIGFMAVGILPARLGEFARPYLVKQKYGIKMSSTIATVIVERIFDVLALVIVVFAVVLKISLPSIIFRTGITVLSISFSILFILIFLAVKKEFSLNKIDIILSKLPKHLEKTLKHLAHSFIEGLQILPDVKKTLYVFFLSLLVWFTIGMSAYLLFFAFGFTLPLINAFAITFIIAIGVMLPAAPGFVGTYHYACVFGLTSFGIPKPEALSYAITLHFLQLIPIVILGLSFLPYQKISLPRFIKNEEEEIEKEGLAD